jgi:hypothetical protein
MGYLPPITEAHAAKRFEQRGYRAVLLTNIVAAGTLKYEYVLLVSAPDSDTPVLAVSSERSRLPKKLRSGSHVLGVFPGDGHINMGASDQWADLAAFERHSLEVASHHLNLEGSWNAE